MRDFDFIEKRISNKLTKIIYEIDYDELKYEKQENICNDALSLCLLLKLEALRACIYFCTEFFKSQQRRRQILGSKWRLK